jgi:hypothetical protein
MLRPSAPPASSALGAGLLLLLAAVAVLPPRARAGGAASDVLGAEGCAACHALAAEAWRASNHRSTFERATLANLPLEVREGRTVQHPPGETTFGTEGQGDGAWA